MRPKLKTDMTLYFAHKTQKREPMRFQWEYACLNVQHKISQSISLNKWQYGNKFIVILLKYVSNDIRTGDPPAAV